jgi:hypothetical protein
VATDPGTDIVKASVDALAAPAKEFAGRVVGSPGHQLGEWLADHIRYRRFKAQLRILEKAEKLVRDAGLTAHEVPLQVLVPLLERGSFEEDEEMVDRFAALLARAATEAPGSVPPSFPAILAELAPIEAAILQATWERATDDAYWRERRRRASAEASADLDDRVHGGHVIFRRGSGARSSSTGLA